MDAKNQSDITKPNWIERLPESWHPYLILGRFDRPIGIWLLLLPGLWGIALASQWPFAKSIWPYILILIFILGAAIMRAAGCVMNDIADRKLDQNVTRTATRPLASGALSVPQALTFLSGLLVFGFCLLLLLPSAAIWLGFLVVPMIAIYPLMKRITYFPQVFLGLTFNFSALMGWAAVADGLSLSALLLYCSGVLWTIGYDTIYAHQDAEDDALVGIKSTALKFGDDSPKWVRMFYTLSFLCLFFALSNIWVFGVVFLLPAAWHLYNQLRLWNQHDANNCLSIFKSNRDYGLWVLGGIIAANCAEFLVDQFL